MRPREVHSYGQLRTRKPRAIWDDVYTDVLGPFPVTGLGNAYVHTFQEARTGYVFALAAKDASASTAASFFVEHIVFEHEAPRNLFSDNATTYTSELAVAVSEIVRTRRINPDPYHPQPNRVERAHGTLEDVMRALVLAFPLDWDLLLPVAVRALNNKSSSTTGFSPYFLMHGREPRELADLVTLPPGVDLSPAALAHVVVTRLRQAQPVLDKCLERARARAQRQLDDSTRLPPFVVGDHVIVEIKAHPVGVSPKLAPRYEGPARVE